MDELASLRKKISDLEQKNRLFNETEKAGKIGVWQFDPATLKQSWTDGVFRILEIDQEKDAHQVPKGLEFIDPEYRPDAEKAVQRAIELGEPYNQEWIVITNKGNKKWVNAVGNPTIKNGKVISVSGSFKDISDKKKAEEKSIKSEKTLKKVFDNSPFPTAVVDEQDYNILYWSKSAVELFGHNPKTIQEWYELAYPIIEYRKQVIESWQTILKTIQNSITAVNAGEYKIQCKDGSIKICEIYGQFIQDYLIITLNDISERKNAEEQLKAQNQQLAASEQELKSANQLLKAKELQLNNINRKIIDAKLEAEKNANRYVGLIDNLESGIVIHAADTTIIRHNQRACDLLGLSKDQLKGKEAIDPYWKFVDEEQTPLNNKDYPVNRILTSKKPIKNQIIGVCKKNNNIVWLMVNGIPISDNYEITEIIISFIDITKRKNTEDHLKSLNHQLQANEQQLKATNQQLQVNEQQLRAANQQ